MDQKVSLPINAFIFMGSACLVAFGQPDRSFVLSFLGVVLGFSGIFFLLKNQGFKVALLWAALVFSFHLSWLATTRYHGVSILFAYVLVVLLFSLQFAALFGFGIKKEFSYSRGLLLAALWTLIEWSRLYYFCGFPFAPVGVLLTFHPIVMQLAAVCGIYGLSFILIFFSYLVAFAKWKSALCIVLVLCTFGVAHIAYWERYNDKEPYFDIALVQTGLSVEEKDQIPVNDQWERVTAFLEQSGRTHFDLIVLPEVAFTIGEKAFHLEMAKKIANFYRSEVVIGLIDENLEGAFNAAFHLSPDSDVFERYEKRVLVPLAEYLPLDALKSFLMSYGITSFFQPGKGAKVFSGKIPFSVSICYEEGFAHLTQEARKLGAKLLVNLTNDGWFPNSRLPEEHFNLGRVRAVENGVYVLRACNTGITAVVDPFGRVISRMKECDLFGNLNHGVQIASINCYSYSTLFSQFGNKVILLFCTAIVGFYFLIKRKSFSRVLSSIREILWYCHVKLKS